MSRRLLLIVALVLGATPLAAQSPPTVGPKGGVYSTTPNASGLSRQFTVYNNDDFSERFILSCTTSGSINSCTKPANVQVAAFGSAPVTVGFASGAAGTGVLTLTASAAGGSDQGYYTVTVAPPPAPAIVIGPDSVPANVPVSSTGLTATFTVRNTGTGSGSFTFTTGSCTAPATSCSAPSPSSATLAPDSTRTVTITYATTSSVATGGVVRLHGVVDTLADDGTTLVATYRDPPLQDTAAVGAGTERDLCLSFSLTAGAATECGDLRLVYPLPPIQSLGKVRAPTLLYNSQTAHPYPLVQRPVTLPTGQAVPTTVRATLLVNGVARDSGSWAGSDWGSAGVTRMISLGYDAASDSTNVYGYILQVVGITGGVRTTLTADTGQLVVVNRGQSAFGAGWWLAGLEQLLAQPDSAWLFVGGDGSSRVYTRVSGQAGMWRAPQVDHPDWLEWTGTEYVQHLPGGLTVHFDAAGRHTSTVNRLGHVTTFSYDSTCHQLSTITTPIGSLSYRFTYTTFGTPPCGNRRLASVTAPPIGTQPRVVTLTPTSTGQVTAIQDVDSTTIHYGYDTMWPTRIVSRTNELGTVVSMAYDATGHLQQVRDSMGTAPAIVTTYTDAATRGFQGSAAVDTAAVTTVVNGPRTDTTITTFSLDRFGAPRTIVNALGQATTLTRGDPRWPALVTRLVAINGLVTTAGYDAQGHLLADTLWSPLGDGQNAIATYAWDGKWDAVTTATTSTGQVTTTAYSGTTGNPVWSVFGGDTTRFAYTTQGLPQTVTTSDGGADSYTYDALGNLHTHTPPVGSTLTTYADGIGRDTLSLTPSGANDTLHVHTWYDRVGADTLVRSWSHTDTLLVRTRYDAAGQDTSVTQHAYPDTNSLGDVTRSFSYDPLGRKTKERLHGTQVLSWTWDAAGNLLVGGHDAAAAVTAYDALNRPIVRTGWYGDTHFTYDSAGNLITAQNPYARTVRTYFPNGLVATDTQKIATTADTSDFSAHVYAIAYQYDIGGRRTALTLPSALGGGTVHYTYDARTGQLATATDPGGTVVRYHYDPMARLDSVLRRDGLSSEIREVRTYDLASRVHMRRIWTPTDTVLLDTVTYDPVGRAVHIATEHGVDTLAYSPLGWVTASDVYAHQSYFTLDAQQNRVSSRIVSGHGAGLQTDWYEAGTGHLLGESDVPAGAYSDTAQDDIDGYGNLVGQVRETVMEPWKDPDGHNDNDWIGLIRTITNQYDESNRLTWHQLVYDTIGGTYAQIQLDHYTATETYRYDPFGRRIWVRSIKGPECYAIEAASGCHSTLTRTIWDGAQILGEIRADGSDSASAVRLEDDTPSAGPNYGVVAYVHAGDLDTPLEILKQDADTVLPIADYRGAIVAGTCPSTPCTTSTLVFPQSSEGIFGEVLYNNGPPSWFGTLLDGQTDGSGYIYRRGRYLDPTTGRFTQEDPLGLAGGLNVYGYANGDPVNYADPFGLWPDAWLENLAARFAVYHPKAARAVAAVTTVAGFVALGLATDGLGDLAAAGEGGELLEAGTVGADEAAVGSESTEAADVGSSTKEGTEAEQEVGTVRNPDGSRKELGQHRDEIQSAQRKFRSKIRSIGKSDQRGHQEDMEEAQRALDQVRKAHRQTPEPEP